MSHDFASAAVASPALAHAPLAIGGVGGSGTRVVAAAAIALGVSMGHDLNDPLDNLGFTLLFKHAQAPALPEAEFDRHVALFAAAMTGTRRLNARERQLLMELAAMPRPGFSGMQHSAEWLAERARRLAEPVPALPPAARWGWKEPNTHVVLPQLLSALPGLRYVHVVRNGLDMAFSRNQNQLALWGERWLQRPVRPVPHDALAYWCAVHRRIQTIGNAMGPHFLWLDYDAMCAEPARELERLIEFLDAPRSALPTLLPLVQPQPTSGRHRAHPLDGFAVDDLDYLRSLGHL